jgi:large subunit ribosomal protein L25
MDQVSVEATLREERGKNAARRARKNGQVPAVLYGGTGEAIAVSLNSKQLSTLLRSEHGHNSILKLKMAGGEEAAMLKDWQVDPVAGTLTHVDLLRIAMDVRMKFNIPVHTFGEPAGVKLQGGVFEVVSREVEIECLPADIPDEVRIDVSGLMMGKQLRAVDLPLDKEKVRLVSDPQLMIAHVVAPRAEEEKPAEAVAADAAAAAEPEVIKKGKKEVEGEEGAEGATEKAEKPKK